jgi:uncharacterized protein
MAGDKARGRFVWHDLMTTDPTAAVEFYTKVLGWGTEKWQGPGSNPDYSMWTANGQALGGVMPLPDEVKAMGVPPHWIAYVASEDVDATAKQTEKLGGRVLTGPMDIPTVGRFAILSDLQGATFAAFTAADDAPGHDGPSKMGEFSWHELMTTDHEAAFDFYHALFGWDKMEGMDMGPMGIYQIYGRNGTQLGGMFNKTSEMAQAPNAWVVYVRVPDVNKAGEAVKSAGGQILNGPMEVPGGDWITQCMDPQGAMFAVHHSSTLP